MKAASTGRPINPTVSRAADWMSAARRSCLAGVRRYPSKMACAARSTGSRRTGTRSNNSLWKFDMTHIRFVEQKHDLKSCHYNHIQELAESCDHEYYMSALPTVSNKERAVRGRSRIFEMLEEFKQ